MDEVPEDYTPMITRSHDNWLVKMNGVIDGILKIIDYIEKTTLQ